MSVNIEELRTLCLELPAVTEDIKWENNLCFCIARKIFLMAALDVFPVTAAFKVPKDEFVELSGKPGFKPAPYLGRYQWVLMEDLNNLTEEGWKFYIRQSYDLVKDRLPKKIRQQYRL